MRIIEKLPIELCPSKPTWEQIGFEFLGQCADKPNLQKVRMPEGWELERFDEDFRIYDERGRVRGQGFVTSAWRNTRSAAFGCLENRFDVREKRVQKSGTMTSTYWFGDMHDNGEPLYVAGVATISEKDFLIINLSI